MLPRRRSPRCRRKGAAGDRAGYAHPRRNRVDATRLRRALGWTGPRRLRRRTSQPLRRGDRPRSGRPTEPDSRDGLPAGRSRLALDALSGRRPALPSFPDAARGDRRRGLHGGRPVALAPIPLADRAAVRGGKGVRVPGTRLRPSGPVTFHVAPLLGGRRHRPAAPDRLDGALPGRGREQGQSSPGALADRVAAADTRDGEGPGGRDRRAGSVRLLGAGCVGRGSGPHARRGRAGRPGDSTRPGPAGRRIGDEPGRRAATPAGTDSPASPLRRRRSPTRPAATRSPAVCRASRR
jgi:hypothetical protein